jgi:hypothetical protein
MRPLIERGIKYLMCGLLILLQACENRESWEKFFRPAPVEPIAGVIRTSLSLGYLVTIAKASELGFEVPGEKCEPGNGLVMIRIVPGNEFPLQFLDEDCSEVIILSLPVDEQVSLISLFFIHEVPGCNRKKILEYHSIPTQLHENKLTAVYAAQDIRVRDTVDLLIAMGPAEIRMQRKRLEISRPQTSEAAIRQEAWFIDVDPSGTWNDPGDDIYTITGGSQNIQTVESGGHHSAGIIQLSMLETTMSPGCNLAPGHGYGMLQEISVEQSSGETPEDLVIGSLIYEFMPGCTGRFSILLATGNFITSTGKMVELNLYRAENP